MSLYPKFRDVHLYVGLALLIPLVLIAGTGVLLNHERLVGLKPSLPKEHDQHEKNAAKPAGDQASRAALTVNPGDWNSHTGAIDSAVAASAAEWGQTLPLERIELKDDPGYGLVVKVKAAKAAAAVPEEFVWSVAERKIVRREGDPKSGVNWAKVVHDLHTGMIFSREYGYFWSDLAGISIVLLSGTGIVLYAIPLIKKLTKKKAAKAPAAKAQPAAGRAPLRPSETAAAVSGAGTI